MTIITYYFDKTSSEIVSAVKSGIIPYEDLILLLKNEEAKKNRVSVRKVINKQIKKLENDDLKSERQQLKTKRLESRIKSQIKKLDLTNRIVSVVAEAIGDIDEISIPAKYESKDKHSEEIAVLLMSDVHIGKKTKSYNSEALKKRMEILKKSMMSVITGLRTIRPIDKLVMVFNGDFIDNESLYKTQAIEGIEVTVIDQIFSLGVPILTEFILYCLANFEEVEIRATSGN